MRTDDINAEASQAGITRRQALKRGLAVGAALAWATPVVQAVGIRPAYAKAPSSGCHRYCLKWTPGGPAGSTCPPTAPGEMPDPDALIAWTGAWEALGGMPHRQSDEDDDGSVAPSGTEEGTEENGDGGCGDTPDGTESDDRDCGGHHPPGNCLECPKGADAGSNKLPPRVKQLLRKQVAIYGLPDTGFLVTFPAGWSVASLDDGDSVAVKCGRRGCNTEYRMQTAPCGDEGRTGFFIRACSNGKAISHLELILDIC